MDEQKRKDQVLWFVTEFQRIQLGVGPLGCQVGCFVFYPLFMVTQGPMNSSNLIGQNLSNLKGVMFHGVPHASGIEDLSRYFLWQCQ